MRPRKITSTSYCKLFKEEHPQKIAAIENRFSKDLVDLALEKFSALSVILNRYLAWRSFEESLSSSDFIRNNVLQPSELVLPVKHKDDLYLYNDIRPFVLKQEEEIMDMISSREECERIDDENYSITRPSKEEMPDFLEALSQLAKDYLEASLEKFPAVIKAAMEVEEAAKKKEMKMQMKASAKKAEKRKEPESDFEIAAPNSSRAKVEVAETADEHSAKPQSADAARAQLVMDIALESRGSGDRIMLLHRYQDFFSMHFFGVKLDENAISEITDCLVSLKNFDSISDSAPNLLKEAFKIGKNVVDQFTQAYPDLGNDFSPQMLEILKTKFAEKFNIKLDQEKVVEEYSAAAGSAQQNPVIPAPEEASPKTIIKRPDVAPISASALEDKATVRFGKS